MAKLNPIFGKFQGRLGGNVLVIRNGAQIIREYNPAPQNPQTPAQVETRAKLKTLSQLAAVMGPSIAIPRQGMVSSRNQFTMVNYGSVTYADSEASIDLTSVQLTKSVIALPAITATRASGGGVTAGLSTLDQTLTRVVFVLIAKGDEKLHVVGSRTASTAGGSAPFFAVSFPAATSTEAYVLAYGMRDNTEKAQARFGNLISPTSEDIAKIIVTSDLTADDVTLTMTRGTMVVPEG